MALYLLQAGGRKWIADGQAMNVWTKEKMAELLPNGVDQSLWQPETYHFDIIKAAMNTYCRYDSLTQTLLLARISSLTSGLLCSFLFPA